MNGNCSTTGKKPERLPDNGTLGFQWKSIDWKKAEAEVNRLQARIAKATQEKNWNTVKKTSVSTNPFVLCKSVGRAESDHQQREKHLGS